MDIFSEKRISRRKQQMAAYSLFIALAFSAASIGTPSAQAAKTKIPAAPTVASTSTKIIPPNPASLPANSALAPGANSGSDSQQPDNSFIGILGQILTGFFGGNKASPGGGLFPGTGGGLFGGSSGGCTSCSGGGGTQSAYAPSYSQSTSITQSTARNTDGSGIMSVSGGQGSPFPAISVGAFGLFVKPGAASQVPAGMIPYDSCNNSSGFCGNTNGYYNPQDGTFTLLHTSQGSAQPVVSSTQSETSVAIGSGQHLSIADAADRFPNIKAAQDAYNTNTTAAANTATNAFPIETPVPNADPLVPNVPADKAVETSSATGSSMPAYLNGASDSRGEGAAAANLILKDSLQAAGLGNGTGSAISPDGKTYITVSQDGKTYALYTDCPSGDCGDAVYAVNTKSGEILQYDFTNKKIVSLDTTPGDSQQQTKTDTNTLFLSNTPLVPDSSGNIPLNGGTNTYNPENNTWDGKPIPAGMKVEDNGDGTFSLKTAAKGFASGEIPQEQQCACPAAMILALNGGNCCNTGGDAAGGANPADNQQAMFDSLGNLGNYQALYVTDPPPLLNFGLAGSAPDSNASQLAPKSINENTNDGFDNSAYSTGPTNAQNINPIDPSYLWYPNGNFSFASNTSENAAAINTDLNGGTGSADEQPAVTQSETPSQVFNFVNIDYGYGQPQSSPASSGLSENGSAAGITNGLSEPGIQWQTPAAGYPANGDSETPENYSFETYTDCPYGTYTDGTCRPAPDYSGTADTMTDFSNYYGNE